MISSLAQYIFLPFRFWQNPPDSPLTDTARISDPHWYRQHTDFPAALDPRYNVPCPGREAV